MVLFVGSFKIKDKKSLITSIGYQHTIMIHTKRVIFMILPLLFVPLVYGLSSSPNACAEPKDPNWGYGDNTACIEIGNRMSCCWSEPDLYNPGETITWCQTCDGDGTNCGPITSRSPPPSPTGPFTPPQGGVEQPPASTPPPLFGENTNVPPTGGIEQPPTTTTPQIPPRLPGGGANVPTEGGSAEQPPTPQDDNQGGGLPTINNQENVPPGGGVAEQPEDDGQQEDSSEGLETAGPLT